MVRVKLFALQFHSCSSDPIERAGDASIGASADSAVRLSRVNSVL